MGTGLTARMRFKEAGLIFDKDPRQVGGPQGGAAPRTTAPQALPGRRWPLPARATLLTRAPHGPPTVPAEQQVRGYLEQGQNRFERPLLHGHWDSELYADMPDGSTVGGRAGGRAGSRGRNRGGGGAALTTL